MSQALANDQRKNKGIVALQLRCASKVPIFKENKYPPTHWPKEVAEGNQAQGIIFFSLIFSTRYIIINYLTIWILTFHAQGSDYTLWGSVLRSNTKGSRFYAKQYLLHICSQIYLQSHILVQFQTSRLLTRRSDYITILLHHILSPESLMLAHSPPHHSVWS